MLKNVVNVEEARNWDGPDGEDWTKYEDRYNAGPARYMPHFLRAANIQPGERVLDIGCGTGETTRAAARAASAGSALGVDLSSRMLERAREHAADEGLTNVAFEQADAQVHEFERGAFDLAISRFGVMFFRDITAAFRNIAFALRSDGRVAFMTWQAPQHNEWMREVRAALVAGRTMEEPQGPATGGPGPFALSDPDVVKRHLTEAGFRDVKLQDVREKFVFGTNAEDAYAFMQSLGITRGMLRDVDDAVRERALAGLRATAEAHETADGVLYDSAVWLTTARR
jgi:ubiquinone/menaquinone biosynthesis C-methylase UbiE